MIYRRRQVEVDALPLYDEARGITHWLVMPRRSDGEMNQTIEVDAKTFEEEYEQGSAARFTEEHLQRLVQQCAQLTKEIRSLQVPSTQSGRPAYREGYSDAVQTLLRGTTLADIQSHLKDISSEYSDWDPRYFVGR